MLGLGLVLPRLNAPSRGGDCGTKIWEIRRRQLFAKVGGRGGSFKAAKCRVRRWKVCEGKLDDLRARAGGERRGQGA